jgi:hypothetical protein
MFLETGATRCKEMKDSSEKTLWHNTTSAQHLLPCLLVTPGQCGVVLSGWWCLTAEAPSCTSVVIVLALLWLPTKFSCIFGVYIWKWALHLVLMASRAATADPEPPSVQVFSNWCESLAQFSQPFPLSAIALVLTSCCRVILSQGSLSWQK